MIVMFASMFYVVALFTFVAYEIFNLDPKGDVCPNENICSSPIPRPH